MFTRIARVVLWIMVVVIALALIIAGGILIADGSSRYYGGSSEVTTGLIVIFGGLIAEFFTICFLGMRVEQANNILDIKKMLKAEIERRQYNGGAAYQEQGYSNSKAGLNYQQGYSNSNDTQILN